MRKAQKKPNFNAETWRGGAATKRLRRTLRACLKIKFGQSSSSSSSSSDFSGLFEDEDDDEHEEEPVSDSFSDRLLENQPFFPNDGSIFNRSASTRPGRDEQLTHTKKCW